MGGYAYRLPRRYRYRGYRRSGEIPMPVLVVAVILLAGFATGGKAPAAGHGAQAAGVPRGPVPAGGTLSCAGLERLWESAGGSPSAAFLAAEVAMAESGGRQYASLYNTNGTTDRGYFQINSVHGSLSTFDPAGNARAAVAISQNGADWSPWTTYDTGAYRGRC
jgi:hypothetical protein